MAGLTREPGEVVRYVAGSEWDPGDSAGEDALVVRIDDTFALDNRFRGTARGWAGTLTPGTAAALRSAIAASGFPKVPAHALPGGSALRVVIADGRSATLAWHAGGTLPGYRELFETLDAIIARGKETLAEPPVASVAEAGQG